LAPKGGSAPYTNNRFAIETGLCVALEFRRVKLLLCAVLLMRARSIGELLARYSGE
jgi:hypothetical protein